MMATPTQLNDLTNSALLILRVSLGLVVVGHGVQKVTHWIGGGGLQQEAAILAKDGVRGGKLSAAASGVTQIGAGLLCALGLLTPLAAAGIIGVMLVAAFTKGPHGFWVQDDGYEFPLFLAVTAVVLALSGPGEWSLDHVAGIKRTVLICVGAIALGSVAGTLSAFALRSPKERRGPTRGDPTNDSLPSS